MIDEKLPFQMSATVSSQFVYFLWDITYIPQVKNIIIISVIMRRPTTIRSFYYQYCYISYLITYH